MTNYVNAILPLLPFTFESVTKQDLCMSPHSVKLISSCDYRLHLKKMPIFTMGDSVHTKSVQWIFECTCIL